MKERGIARISGKRTRRPVRRMALALALPLLALGAVAARADYDSGLAAYDRGDFAAALSEWLPLAEKGDPQAEHGVGMIYEAGIGIGGPDLAQAVRWYTAAAAQGVAAAQNNLALMYAEGRGVPRDLTKAAELWRQAAEAGHPIAQFNLGLMLYRGDGMPKDVAKAAKWFARAAQGGSVDAQYAMGELLRLGIGVDKDIPRARGYYQMAAAKGMKAAADRLAELGPGEAVASAAPAPLAAPTQQALASAVTSTSDAAVETAPAGPAPVETATAETATAETAPVETAPVETAPVETAPVETAPVGPLP
ncbi:MAG: sel1 repeat family protein, partial [Rhodospirillaceae bacterium]|nr:sel1 repeat family protein [Rhodospirillaceae bacterium]